MPASSLAPARRALARVPRLALALALVALLLAIGPTAGHAAAALKVTPSPDQSVRTIVGGKPVNIEFTFTNTGVQAEPLTVHHPHSFVAVGGHGFMADFEGHHCEVTLAPGASCTVRFRFAPPRLGTYEGAWYVQLGSHGHSYELRWEGVEPHLRWERHADFGTVAQDAEVTKTIKLENPTPGEIKVDRIFVEGDPRSYELLGGDCVGSWIPAQATCGVRVRFHPRDTGTFPSTLVAIAPAGESHHPSYRFTGELSGEGGRSALAATPGSIGFGTVKVGASAGSRAVTITNSGTVATHVLAAFAGAAAQDFRLVGPGCNGELPPGVSCNLEISFVPTATGPRRAQLILLTDGSGRSTVTLEGSGA